MELTNCIENEIALYSIVNYYIRAFSRKGAYDKGKKKKKTRDYYTIDRIVWFDCIGFNRLESNKYTNTVAFFHGIIRSNIICL